MLPEGGRERLREQLQAVRRRHEKELGNRNATIWIRAWFSKQFAVPRGRQGSTKRPPLTASAIPSGSATLAWLLRKGQET
jgi:hypothetical protein